MLTRISALFVAALAATASLSRAEAVHGDFTIASTASGGGAFTLDFDFGSSPDVLLSKLADIGGGQAIYTANDPGFAALDADEPEEGVYQLLSGTQVSLRLLSASAGVALQIGGSTLDAENEAALIGTYTGGETLHVHPTFRVIAPDGDTATHTLSFELFQGSGSTYAVSAPFTLQLSTVVPEPATLGVVAAGAVVMLRRRRNIA